MVSIQLFVPTFRVDECLEEIKECLEIGWTGLGFKTVEFEKKWMEYIKLPNAHFINSATVGLNLAVEILKEEYNWEDGDEVISTPLTFVSTNHAISQNRLKVVFADIDNYLCIDPEDLERKITDKTRGVIFVGIGGNTGQYEKIVEICKIYNLRLILDAAHMTGTLLNGNAPGKEADVVVYSFQAVKNLPTADSGMICFREKIHDDIARKKTWLGINKDTYRRTVEDGIYKWKYDVEYIGHKYHGNSIMAAIGLVQLKYLEQDNAYRKQVAMWYDAGFMNMENIKPILPAPGCDSSRHLYQIEVDRRDELMLFLNEQGIYPGVHYADNTQYKMYKYAQGTCPKAERMSDRIITLPIHLRLSKNDVDFVVEKVVQFSS